MSYNMKELPQYINTAGKITVITAILGVIVFTAIFMLNFGAQELRHVEAQGLATTSVTVLNTPPQWTIDAQESTPSSTTTPGLPTAVSTWSGSTLRDRTWAIAYAAKGRSRSLVAPGLRRSTRA